MWDPVCHASYVARTFRSAPRDLLEGLKAGDVIEITYTRERAITLERQP